MTFKIDPKGLFLACASGVAGAYLFNLLALPLALMLGAMCTTALLALSGCPLAFPRSALKFVGAVVGVLLGANTSWDMLVPEVDWIVSLTVLLGLSILVTLITFVFLRRVGKMDAATAFYGGTPGGVTEFALLAENAGGDMKSVAFLHSVRIFTTVLAIPIILLWVSGGEQYIRTRIEFSNVNFMGLFYLIILAVAGTGIGHVLRLPAKAFLGPIFLTIAAKEAGFLDGFVRSQLWLQVSQVVLGTAIGSAFVGSTWSTARQLMTLSLVISLFSIALAFSAAVIITPYAGGNLQDLILAFAPAGLMEMSLIASSQNADVPYVMTHHIIRILQVSLIAPIIWKLWKMFGN